VIARSQAQASLPSFVSVEVDELRVFPKIGPGGCRLRTEGRLRLRPPAATGRVREGESISRPMIRRLILRGSGGSAVAGAFRRNFAGTFD